MNINKFECLATCAFGLEGIVKRELQALGILDGKGEVGGVRFSTDLSKIFKANLWLRCADRVLIIVKQWEAKTFEELYQGVYSVPWSNFLLRDSAFPVSGKCVRSQLMSVSDCQSITKKAIVDKLKKKYFIDWFSENGATFPLDISITNDIARLTINSTGIPLNRRGYRTWNGEAPLKETLAAALIYLSNWDRKSTFYDIITTKTIQFNYPILKAS